MDKPPFLWYTSFITYESVVGIMPFSFLPKGIIRELPDLTPLVLEKRGVKLLMLDFDNTIVPYTTSIPTEKMETWLERMLDSHIQICVVSNSKRERVKVFCEQYGIPCITHAKKPFSKGIRECLNKYQLAPNQCALAGDQIFTDTLGANCAGCTSILVKAIDNHNIWLKLRHVAELPFIALARHRKWV